LKGRLLFSHLQPPPGAGEASGESQQLVTAIYDQGDSPKLCEQAHKAMTILLFVVALKVLLWSSLQSHRFCVISPSLVLGIFSIYILGSSQAPGFLPSELGSESCFMLIALYFVGRMSVLSSSASIWQMRSFSSTSSRFFLMFIFSP